MENIHFQQQEDNEKADEMLLRGLIQVLRTQPDLQVQYKEKSEKRLISVRNLKPTSAIRFSTCLKAKNNAITLDIFAVGKLEIAAVTQNFVFEQQTKKYNQCYVKEDCVVYWVKNNHNFAARRTISNEFLQQMKIEQQKKYFTYAIQILEQILQKCINQINSTRSQSTGESEEVSKTKKPSHLKKLSTMQKLKYQFEINRKKRTKASNCDFYKYQVKTLQQLHEFNKLNRNESYHEKLKKITTKNAVISTREAFEAFDKLAKKFSQKQQQTLFHYKVKEKKQILNAIKIYQETPVENRQNLEGTFSQIQVVQSRFGIIFSVNSKTNTQLQQDLPMLVIKQENHLMVKKNKRMELAPNMTPKQLANSKIVFEIEIEILLFLKSYYHDSICEFFIKQYDDKSEITSIYSQKHPYDSFTMFCDLREKISSQLKLVCKILKFLTEIAQGIWFLWKVGILHRDFKPSNVVIDSKGKSKIIDFGSACPIYDGKENPNDYLYSTIRSTIGYYSSYSNLFDLIKRQYTRQQYERHEHFDVYALGAITQKMLEGISMDGNPELRENLNYFIKKSKDRHPDDRLNPLQAALFLRIITSYALFLYQSIQK